MLLTIKKIFLLLTDRHKVRLIFLLIMTLIMALLDMAGVASVMPFLTVLSNPELIETNSILKTLFNLSTKFGIESIDQFIFFFGILLFLFLILTLSFKALTLYAQIRFANFCEFSLSKKFMKNYLRQPYSWFFNRHSAEIGKNILSDCGQIIGTGVKPLINLMTNLFAALALITLLILVDFKVALITGLILFVTYGIIYLIYRIVLFKVGKDRLNSNKMRFNIIVEAFSGIKEIKLGGMENFFINRFSESARLYARSCAYISSVSNLPRFALEGVGFGGIILILLMIIREKGNITDTIPIIALYTFAGYRLLPAIQNVFASLTQLRFITPTIDNLYIDAMDENFENKKNQENIDLNQNIVLKNVSYIYPDTHDYVLKNISMNIPVGSNIGIIGPTGCGKTTLIDIIIGLLKLKEGKFEIDGITINDNNSRAWQSLIGYVPQNIYLINDSISANIAFGVEHNNIDHNTIEKVAKIANIHDFIINDLPQKYETFVGERGLKLSGGQLQRIAIARALYNNPKLLVLDEATSALDDKTEKLVMDAVYNLKKQNMTVIMIAHRLSTLSSCDQIFSIDKGKINKQGKFDELINKN